MAQEVPQWNRPTLSLDVPSVFGYEGGHEEVAPVTLPELPIKTLRLRVGLPLRREVRGSV